MISRPRFWGLHARPRGLSRWLIAAIPFILVIMTYATASHMRLQENPSDKLLPSLSQMADATYIAAFQESRRTGERILWSDTASSLIRLVSGLLVAAILGLSLGIITGLFPGGNGLVNPFLTTISMIPPISILPILFITLGVGEASKIVLIVIGLFPLIARDMRLAVSALPGEQLTKALTLGADGLHLIWRIVLPQVLPRLIESVRLSLGAAWLFLIAAEAITAESGLGYRIFLVRRYLAMDTILPYVLWITLLGFLFDLGLRGLLKLAFPWYQGGRV